MAVAVTTEGIPPTDRCPLWLHIGQSSRSRFLRAFSDGMGSSTTKKFINRLNGIRKVKLNILTCFLRYLFSFDSELLNSFKCFQPTTGGWRKWNGFDVTLLAPVKASKPPEGLRTKGPAGSKEQTPKRKWRLNAGPGAVKLLARRAAPHLAANSEAPPPPTLEHLDRLTDGQQQGDHCVWLQRVFLFVLVFKYGPLSAGSSKKHGHTITHNSHQSLSIIRCVGRGAGGIHFLSRRRERREGVG